MSEEKVAEAASLWDEATNPINLLFILVILYFLYMIIKSKFKGKVNVPTVPKIRKDLTVAELRKYDGTQPDGRVLLALNSVIFDVTKEKRFYGPGGPYSAFSGKDATRGLATGVVAAGDKEWDDISDLTPSEVAAAKEWEEKFRAKYCVVGKLRKPSDDISETKKSH